MLGTIISFIYRTFDDSDLLEQIHIKKESVEIYPKIFADYK